MQTITVNRVARLEAALVLLAAISAMFASLAEAQIAPPSPAVGAKVPGTYFGPVPSDVKKELVGPYKLLKAGDVDLKAETVTLPLYEGRMKDGRKVWYILTDTTDAGNAALIAYVL